MRQAGGRRDTRRVDAVRAAHAFDGTRFLPGGATVLVDDGRIVGVETGRTDLPDGVRVTEHSGTVLPGLIDCHTHLVADSSVGGLERTELMTDDEIDAVVADSLRAQLVAGVTTVRDLGDRGYRTLGFRQRPGLPRVVAAGPPLTTAGGHCHFLGGAVDGDLRAAVAERADRGVDVVKVMASGGFATPGSDQLGAQFTVDELAVMVDEAHRRDLPLVAHAHSLVGIRHVLAAGVDGIEHFTGLTATGVELDDGLLAEVARRGTFVDLTMGNDLSEVARMPALPPPLAALIAKLGAADFVALNRSRIEVFGRLRAHGVRVVSGVDSGMAPPKRHGNAWRTVPELVEGGYPVDEALATLTSVAAEACGLTHETGRLAPGLAADLLVVDGDLEQDPTVLSRPRQVMVRGTTVDLG